jgi:hypothetical protein
MHITKAILLALLMPALTLQAGQTTGTEQSTRLYTKPDPNATGGLQGSIINAAKPILQAVAVDRDNPKKAYLGTVEEKGAAIRFAGLPAAIYDLMLVAGDRFYEGCVLSRDPDNLTDRDRKLIEKTIMKSTPFFDTKKIHRCKGATGSSGKARCVLQEVRTHPVTLQSGEVRTDIQVRSLKLAFLEEVGDAGWQLVQTRELVRAEVGPNDIKGVLPHSYRAILGGIRVVDTVKNLGTLDLKLGLSDSGQ